MGVVYEARNKLGLTHFPAESQYKPLKFAASINDEALRDQTDPNYEMLYVDVTNADGIRGILEKQRLRFSVGPSRARRIVRDGDIIVSTVRTYLRAIVRIVHAEDNLIVSTGFAVVRPRAGLRSDFASNSKIQNT
jgi:type I restriction enzyme S subunit